LYVTRLETSDILFRNRGDGTFEDVTDEAGLSDFQLLSNGALWADFDNDGDLDLYVTTIADSRYYLFINDGSGRFSEEAVARGAAVESGVPHTGQGIAAGDYNRDGWLDLYVAEWGVKRVDRSAEPHSRLLRNLGRRAPGFFEDTTERAGVRIDTDDSYAFGPAFVDLDDDGWQDLAITSDFGTSKLFWNNGDGTFRDGTRASRVGRDQNGMGSTFGDFDGDGDLDWFVTSIYRNSRNGNYLYRNNGDRTFTNRTSRAGVRDGAFGWVVAFFDADNDGDLDLVMTNGSTTPRTPVQSRTDVVRFWRNEGPETSFTEMAAQVGLADTGNGKGLLTLDYDRDGDLDVLIVNNHTGARLFRNDAGNQLSWLGVRPLGRQSSLESYGARVRVQVEPEGVWQVREIGVGSHFLGQSELTAHFGLGPGDGPVAHVEVTWLSGSVTRRTNVPRNSVLVIREPAEGCPSSPRPNSALRLPPRSRAGSPPCL